MTIGAVESLQEECYPGMMNAPIFLMISGAHLNILFIVKVTLENFHTTLDIESIWALYHQHFFNHKNNKCELESFSQAPKKMRIGKLLLPAVEAGGW